MTASVWNSNLPELNRRFDLAQQKGLRAGAEVLRNAIKRKLRGGYTSGQFVTGNVINSVTISNAERVGGVWAIRVGSNLMYALYWELGHFNLFLNRFIRVEKWRIAWLESRNEVREAYTRVATRVLETGA